METIEIYPLLERTPRGRTPDGCITPEKTLERQRAYDELCATHPPDVVRLAKYLAAQNLFAAGEYLAFDPTHGNFPGCLREAALMLAIARGESNGLPSALAVHELRWTPPSEQSA
jgi:hypothetical protein